MAYRELHVSTVLLEMYLEDYKKGNIDKYEYLDRVITTIHYGT